jgi:hypothetical protein
MCFSAQMRVIVMSGRNAFELPRRQDRQAMPHRNFSTRRKLNLTPRPPLHDSNWKGCDSGGEGEKDGGAGAANETALSEKREGETRLGTGVRNRASVYMRTGGRTPDERGEQDSETELKERDRP